MQEETIFDKIIRKEIPSTVIYEDDECLCFKDISPAAPIHYLLIPKNKNGLSQLSKAQEKNKEVLGHLMVKAGEIGNTHCPQGFRIVINDGKQGGQEVYHLHIHILGGSQCNWPPGTKQ